MTLKGLKLIYTMAIITPCHRYRRRKNRLLKFVYVPATSATQNRLLFFFFWCGCLQY